MNEIDREKTSLPLLEAVPGFSDMPDEALRWIAGGCHPRTASRGQVLCEKGQALTGFFILLSGRVKLSILSEGGAERVLDIILPGRSFAEAAAFLDEPCPLYAEALTDTRLLFVDVERLRDGMLRWPRVATWMLAVICRRTLSLIADLEGCCLCSAGQRVAALLLRDAEPDRLQPDRGTMRLPAAKTVVASSLNLTPETFSRELHALAHRGLIEVSRRDIGIPSLRALRAAAEPSR
jgi:CRP-like cAMP-binding protein